MEVVLFKQSQADQVKGIEVKSTCIEPTPLKDGRLITSKSIIELGVVNGLDLSTLPVITVTDSDFIKSTR